MCLYPKLIKNKKYMSNKKNGGVIPAVSDERTLFVPVGCGKCIECLKQKSNNWKIRLFEEIKYNNDYTFVTLTFSDVSLEYLKSKVKINSDIIDNDIATVGVRYFFENIRKSTKKSLKHWLITELGQSNTERVHLHGLIKTTDVDFLRKKWIWGISHFGSYVNKKTINYIVKYVTKVDTKHKNFVPKIFASPGLGKGYLENYNSQINRFKGELTNELYINESGLKISLPIYYRNKIYSEEEREHLWLSKLDKLERFVCGEKVSIKDNLDEYEKLRDFYRKMNKNLGFGDDSLDWDKKTYKYRQNWLRYKSMK